MDVFFLIISCNIYFGACVPLTRDPRRSSLGSSRISLRCPGVGGRTAANGRFHLEGPGLAIGLRGSARFPSLGEAHAGDARDISSGKDSRGTHQHF